MCFASRGDSGLSHNWPQAGTRRAVVVIHGVYVACLSLRQLTRRTQLATAVWPQRFSPFEGALDKPAAAPLLPHSARGMDTCAPKSPRLTRAVVLQCCLQLLASHEDYSTVTSMQTHLRRNPTVITQLRDPVDRLLSAYEFAVEVALRMALKPPAQRIAGGGGRPERPLSGRPGGDGRKIPQNLKRKNATRTDTVWPWSQIVPMMLEDMIQRYLDGGCVASFAHHHPSRGLPSSHLLL